MMHIKDHKLQILPFAPAHLAGVERLEQLCFAHPWQRADLEAQLTNPCARFLVAVLGDKVVGYLGVQAVCGEGSVTNVAVDPTYRRRGIARALFGACFAAGSLSRTSVGGNYLSSDDYGSSSTIPTSVLRKRLKLLSVLRKNGTSQGEKHTFTYNEAVNLPYKTSFAIDYWGYYNGQQNTSTLTNRVHTLIPPWKV